MIDALRFCAYCTLAAACLYSARGSAKPQARLVGAVGVLAILFGLALLFGIAGATVDILREATKADGLYGDRRPVQALVIFAVVAVTGAFGSPAVWMATRTQPSSVRVVVLGALLLACFVTVRAISLHQVDSYLNSEVGPWGLRWGDEIELWLLVCLTAAVLFTPRRCGRSS